jgi:hypothetical protein
LILADLDQDVRQGRRGGDVAGDVANGRFQEGDRAGIVLPI